MKTGHRPSQEDMEELSKSKLLSQENTEISVEHFVSICERRRNNEKRRKNKERVATDTADQVYYICQKEEEGLMIQCNA